MRILLKGYYGYGNLGDDILMVVSYGLLAQFYPNAEIIIFSNNSSNNVDARSQTGYNKYIRKILDKKVEIIDWTHKGYFDLIFHGGGGIYFDHQLYSNTLLNKIISGLSIPITVRMNFLLRLIFNKPKNLDCKQMLGAGIGIGEYNYGSRQLFKDLSELGSYDKLIVRDVASYIFLDKKKMKASKFLRNTDLAFINSWNNQIIAPRTKINSVGIIIKDNLPAELVELLIYFNKLKTAEGIKVSFFSFDSNYDKDSSVIYGDHCFEQYDPLRMNEFLCCLGKQDLLITSRAHGAILGSCMRIPSIILGVELKLNQVFQMLENSCILLESWDKNSLEGAFDIIEKNYEKVQQNLEVDFISNHEQACSIGNLIF